MRINIFFLIVNLIIAFSTRAQSENAQARIVYQFSHIKNLLVPNSPHREMMALEFTSEASMYRSIEVDQLDSVINANTDKNGNILFNKVKLPTSEKIYHKFLASEIQIERPFSGQDFIYKEAKPDFNWIITDKEKLVGGFNCLLAIGSFRGREYHAWFTLDIPISAGPWKLMGLPGLILEAADTTGQVKFELVRIENKPKATPVTLSKRSKSITKQEWVNMMEAFRNNPNAFLSANAGVSASSNTETNVALKSKEPTSSRQPKANNPLELTND